MKKKVCTSLAIASKTFFLFCALFFCCINQIMGEATLSQGNNDGSVQQPSLSIKTPNVSFQLHESTAPQQQAAPLGNLVASGSPVGGTLVTGLTDSPAKKGTQEVADIYLNFENSSLASIINYLCERKKLNVIPHPALETTTVSLSTREPLTLERAFNVLLTLMEMNGFSFINVDGIYRVVLSKDSGFEPLPIYSSGKGIDPDKLPDTSQVIRYIYFLKSLKADIALQLLRSMLEGDGNTVVINRDLNACIIKQEAMNIKSAMKIIKTLDDSGLQEAIRIIPLKHTTADIVANIFNEILNSQPQQERIIKFSSLSQQKETSYFNANTRVIPEPIKNTVILMGAEKYLDRITAFIKEKLDVPIDGAESRLHIKEVKHARAEVLKPIIENIIRPPSGQAVDKSSVVGEFKFFEDVIIAVEEQKDTQTGFGGGNRLIISCNKEDWIRLNKIIDKLDTPQAQVALEIMVIDTDVSRDADLGAQMFNIKGKPLGMGIDMVNFTNLDSTAVLSSDSEKGLIDIARLQGNGNPSFLTFGRPGTLANPGDNNLWAIVRATCNLSNAHVITQPFMVANNYQECVVGVTLKKNVPGELTEGGKSGETIRKRRNMEAKTILRITPKINRDGLVELNINISLADFLPTSGSETPGTTTRVVKTKSLMATGEVIALGGFLTKVDKVSEYKTPVLSSIPILGTLFRSKSIERGTKNLCIFIRPSIIKPEFEGTADEYTQLKLDYAKYQSAANDTYAKERDPIQRWFFKPDNYSVKQTLADAAQQVYRPIDDFTSGKTRPKSVNIRLDSYYKVSESVQKEQMERKKRLLRYNRSKSLSAQKTAAQASVAKSAS